MITETYHVETVVHHYEDEKKLEKLTECPDRVISRTTPLTLESAFYRRLSEHRTLRRGNLLHTMSAHIVNTRGDRF